MPVREAAPKDLDRIVELWFEMMTFHINLNGIYKMKANAPEIYREYAGSCITDPEKAVFVFEDDTGILGYIFAEIAPLPRCTKRKKSAFLPKSVLPNQPGAKGSARNF